MKSHADIVDGGGWLNRQVLRKPRARFFGSLSLIYLAVFICASFVFWDSWPQSFGSLEWICSTVLVLLELVFVGLAVVFSLTEQPRTITENFSNPDYDIRKLY